MTIFKNKQKLRIMKKLILFTISCLFTLLSFAQSDFQGAYLLQEGQSTKLWLFIDGYCSLTNYQQDKYISTEGGPFTYSDGKLQINLEFNDADNNLVGTTRTIALQVEKGNLVAESGEIWKKTSGKAQKLDGNWRITGRQQEDKISIIPRGDRKTIKLLVGGYFQWVAINPAEKGFYGTGGGNYIFENDKYTEQILFFSRDNSRVGAKLNFKGEIKGGKWNHSGLSSKGEPIFEIWTRETIGIQ